MHPSDQMLNEYVDHVLSDPARAEVEHHLETCAECVQLMADLRDVCRQAAELEPMQPPERTWNQIKAALQEPSHAAEADVRGEILVHAPGDIRSRPRSWSLLAGVAAAVLLLTTGIGMRFFMRQSLTSPASMPVSNTRELAESVEAELREAEQHYQKAIDGLEQITTATTDALDPETAAALLKDIALVDRAISESRAALKADPENVLARQSLLEGLKTKVTLLQDTVALINEL